MRFNLWDKQLFRTQTTQSLISLREDVTVQPNSNLNFSFKPTIVLLILNKQTEQALELLAKNYEVDIPKLKIGLPKGHKNHVYGTYSTKDQTIRLMNSDMLGNPFVVLHEFYHHIRSKSVDKQHRGNEKNADKFAIAFIEEYQTAAKNYNAQNSNSS
jgi:hypothetical protein